MKTSADGSETRIEKDGYAPVIFKKGIENNQKGVIEYSGRKVNADLNQPLTPEQRSFDRVIVETHLPDGTIVDTYLDSGLPSYDEDIVGI
jgi:hypothetical protein